MSPNHWPEYEAVRHLFTPIVLSLGFDSRWQDIKAGLRKGWQPRPSGHIRLAEDFVQPAKLSIVRNLHFIFC